MQPPLDLQILYTGNVQGVGFRYTAKQIAAGYEVVGWVQNLPDGRVEMRVGGEEGEVQAFLAAVAGGQLARHIKQVEKNTTAGTEKLPHGFEIRR